MSTDGGLPYLLLIPVIICIIAFGLVITLPAILQVPSTYNGEVSSTQKIDYIIQNTNVNFKDGSHLILWGIYNIPVGNHTFQVTGSWLGISNLQTIDGAHP